MGIAVRIRFSARTPKTRDGDRTKLGRREYIHRHADKGEAETNAAEHKGNGIA